MQKISPFLWFDGQAEDAAKLYTSLFPDSKINRVVPYPEGSPGEPGSTMIVDFELFGQSFTALNGGPNFKFTEAISFSVSCDSQEEIDRYWAALTEGGNEVQCGWLKDRFGLSWQIVPRNMERWLGGNDPEATQRAFTAMMGMVKLDIAAFDRAYRGE